jgi:pimeloyl-ACP methyl ester carboxylesterase
MKVLTVSSVRACVLGLGLCLIIGACGGPGIARPGTAKAGTLRVAACLVEGQPARCGTLWVPEDRSAGDTRAIPIKFVVFPAYGYPRAPDPVVYLDGGPGAAAITDIPTGLSELFAINQHRDLVFIDQRGTGGSNGVACAPIAGFMASPTDVRHSVQACLASLRGRADLQFYTSAMAADDVAQVLTALHYRTVNLFGGSYGATAAQIFQALFPARVRTMTLLGGTLLSVPLFERMPQDSQRALTSVLARCASDPACHSAFPALAAEWQQLRASLAARPVTIPAALLPDHRVARFDEAALAAELHDLLLSADTAVYVPLVIHSLFAARQQPAVIAAVIGHLIANGLPTTSGSEIVASYYLISYPIRCAESWARYQPGQLDRASYYYQYAEHEARWWQQVCTLFPAPGAAASYGQQRRSSLPVLMLNGSADPQDPPADMAGARQLWPDSRLITEPGQSHEILSTAWEQCYGGLVQAFIADANAARVNAACVDNVALPPFPTRW